jgi:hypothetical protein
MFEVYSLGMEPYGEMSVHEIKGHLQAGKRLDRPTLASDAMYINHSTSGLHYCCPLLAFHIKKFKFPAIKSELSYQLIRMFCQNHLNYDDSSYLICWL